MEEIVLCALGYFYRQKLILNRHIRESDHFSNTIIAALIVVQRKGTGHDHVTPSKDIFILFSYNSLCAATIALEGVGFHFSLHFRGRNNNREADRTAPFEIDDNQVPAILTRNHSTERNSDLAQFNTSAERRKWPRLPLAIPLFVRSRDRAGKPFLEFATALNISASGALVVVRRALRLAAQVSLEIPTVPLAAAPVPKRARHLRAKSVRVVYLDGYYVLGLKFSQPLLRSTTYK